MSDLRQAVIKLANENPDLRKHLVPLLKEATEFDSPDALKKYLHEHPDADKSKHSVKKQDGGGGAKKDDPKSKDDPKNQDGVKDQSPRAKPKGDIKTVIQKLKDLSYYSAAAVARMRKDLKANGTVDPKDVEKLVANMNRHADSPWERDREGIRKEIRDIKDIFKG